MTHPDDWRDRDDLRSSTISFRWRLFTLVAVCVAGGLLLAAGTALHRARLEQQSIEETALNVARSTVHAADREIAASLARLQALATSPSLQSGDLPGFYNQLMATPLPDGTWFALYDRERQLLNTSRPFGAPLPRVDQFTANSQAAMRRAFDHGDTIISPVVWGVAAQTHVVAVTIPIPVHGQNAYIIDNILSDRRIAEVIAEMRTPPNWRVTLVDRDQATIAHAGMSERPLGRAVPVAWIDTLRGASNEGIFSGERDDIGLLVAFARSQFSNWTAVVEVPFSPATRPVQSTVRILAFGGAAFSVLAMVAAILTARGADKPIEALRSAEARADIRYRTYWEHTGEGLFVLAVRQDDTVVFEGLNPELEHLSGLRLGHVVGREPHACLPPDDAAFLVSQCRRCLASGSAVQFNGRFDFPSGPRNLETNIAPVRDPASGRIERLLGSVRDVTERHQSEAALRSLGGRILTLQDDERRRLARELHDGTAQTLLGASFAIARVKSASPAPDGSADDACNEALSLIDDAQREIRTLAYLLHPPLLEEMGLPAALRSYVNGLANRSGLHIALTIDPALEGRNFGRDVEAALFRVAQEALTNVQRHSGADTVSVAFTLTRADAPGETETLILSISDNGRGIPSQGRPTDHEDSGIFGVGLLGMRERMRQFGGTLRVRALDPSGTTVEARVAARLPEAGPASRTPAILSR